MIKSRYCDREDIECLADTLQNEDKKQEFCYGFFSAISFAYYKSLSKEEKELYCGGNYGKGFRYLWARFFERIFRRAFWKRGIAEMVGIRRIKVFLKFALK